MSLEALETLDANIERAAQIIGQLSRNRRALISGLAIIVARLRTQAVRPGPSDQLRFVLANLGGAARALHDRAAADERYEDLPAPRLAELADALDLASASLSDLEPDWLIRLGALVGPLLPGAGDDVIAPIAESVRRFYADILKEAFRSAS